MSALQLLSELRHQHIVRFMGACLDNERMAILFELCPRALHDVLHRSREPLIQPDMLHIVREVALGVYYLHCDSVLHLDLKSANVLLDDAGIAKVCDFGMSHVREDAAAASDVTRGGMGSPQWTAPEKLRGQRYDERADVYSYGILLYEVMARRIPYSDVDACELVVGVITRLLPRPRLTDEERKRWPVELINLMKECVSEEPSDRPDFAKVLDRMEELAPKGKRVSKDIFSPRSTQGLSKNDSELPHDFSGGSSRGNGSARSGPSSSTGTPRSVVGELPEASRATASAEVRTTVASSMDEASIVSVSGASSVGAGQPEPSGQTSTRIAAPDELRVHVLHVHKGRDGRPVFAIECEIDDTKWTVNRKESELAELKKELSLVLRFLPEFEPEQRSWSFVSNKRRASAAAKQVEEYLQQLTVNGQWVWEECAVLRQFLQIPVTKQKREAREQQMADVALQKRAHLREEMLDEQPTTNAAGEDLAVGSPEDWNAPARRTDSMNDDGKLDEHSVARTHEPDPRSHLSGLFTE